MQHIQFIWQLDEEKMLLKSGPCSGPLRFGNVFHSVWHTVFYKPAERMMIIAVQRSKRHLF